MKTPSTLTPAARENPLVSHDIIENKCTCRFFGKIVDAHKIMKINDLSQGTWKKGNSGGIEKRRLLPRSY